MIHIVNKQKKLRIPGRKVERLAQRILRGEKERRLRLSVAFVDDAEIRRINRCFLHHRGATDVIAFRYGGPAGPDRLDGEVVISAERAAKEAKKRKIAAEEELLRYVAHGILHVTGYDDKTPAKRKAMWAKQELYLSR